MYQINNGDIMGWMNCMKCGCRVHTSKLPINICDECEAQVEEIENQSTSLPETKEDIDWIPHECDVCGITTHQLKGDESPKGCMNCAINNQKIKIVKEYNVQMDYGKMDKVREEGTQDKYCLCDTLNTKDPETLQTIRRECAALGCNVCLAEQDEDNINWPKHYNTGKIQPIDVIEDWKLDFRLANALKYIARAGKKDSNKTKQDLEKALWYIKRFIDKEC